MNAPRRAVPSRYVYSVSGGLIPHSLDAPQHISLREHRSIAPRPEKNLAGARLIKIREHGHLAGYTVWGVPGRPETYERLTRREGTGYKVELVRSNGQVVYSKRDRGVRRILRRGARGAVRTVVDHPGIAGVVTGFALPFLLPWKVTGLVAAAIGTAGYIAPQGSWFRRFSIGAGIGGSVAGGIALYGGTPPWLRGAISEVSNLPGRSVGLLRVAFSQPWYHYIPVLGPHFQQAAAVQSLQALPR